MRRMLLLLSALFLLRGPAAPRAEAQAVGPAKLEILAKESTLLCPAGETPRIALRINPTPPASPALHLVSELYDLQGARLDLEDQPLSADATQAKVTLTPKIARAGYYNLKVSLLADATPLAKVSTSLASLPFSNTPASRSPFGLYVLGDESLFQKYVEQWNYTSALRLSGAKFGTFEVYWHWLEPEKGRWDWGFTDRRFAELKKAGIQPIPHLFGVPQWASSYKEGMPVGNDGLTHEVYPPKDWALYADFVRRFVERYKDELPYLRIWNEYNSEYWMGSMEDFTKMLQIAYKEAHAVKPDIKIVIDVAMNKLSYFEALERLGGLRAFDVISIHNYEFEQILPPERLPYGHSYKILVDWIHARRPEVEVWDSEFCWLAEPWANPSWLGHGEVAQAQFLARAYLLGLGAGLSRMVWFPAAPWAWTEHGQRYHHSGSLVREDGSPRPAFAAYHTLAHLLDETQSCQELACPSGNQRAYSFKTGRGYVTALWCIEGEPEWLTLETEETTIKQYAMLGEAQTLVAQNQRLSLPLSPSPTYLLSRKPLRPIEREWNLAGLNVDVSLAPYEATPGIQKLQICLENESAMSRDFDLHIGKAPVQAGFGREVLLGAGETKTIEGSLFVPSGNLEGRLGAELTIEDKGSERRHTVPFEIPVAKAKQSLWKADTPSPASYTRHLPQGQWVEKLLLSFPESVAYQIRVEAHPAQGGPQAWKTVLPSSVVSGPTLVEVRESIDAVRVHFENLLKNGGLEEENTINLADRKRGSWEIGRQTEFYHLEAGKGHTGRQCIKLDPRNLGRPDVWTSMQQYLPVEENRYYSFTAYAKQPANIDAWAGLFAVGEPQQPPNSYAVLPYVDDRWHKLSVTVRAGNGQNKLRIACGMYMNGTACFDDIMGIPGKIPTDIPEIVALDVIGKRQ